MKKVNVKRTFIFWSASTNNLQPVIAGSLEKAQEILKKSHPNIDDWVLETPKSKNN